MIIGLTGVARSGKDTVGKILMEYGFNRYGFADKLKDLAFQANPLVNSPPIGFGELSFLSGLVTSYGWEKAKENDFVRQFLQNLGVGARKVFGENFWVDQVISDITEKYGVYTSGLGTKTVQSNIVITDVRFDNEAKAISGIGGLVIKVDRGLPPLNLHVSEKGLSPNLIDGTIYNTGSLEELENSVKEMLNFLGFGGK